jgi:nucleotide-binding universal stress UspA family protein
MYSTILVPTDGSVSARRAAEHAVDIAAKYGAAVEGLSVIDTSAETRFYSREGVEEFEERQREQAEHALDELVELAEEEGVPIETTIEKGTPDRVILEFAEDCGADLVLMGTHGLSKSGGLVLGSVTEKVVRESTVPTQVVRLTDVAVGTISDAVEAAREAAMDAGHDSVSVVRTHRSGHTWMVHVVGGDEREWTVNVDVESGETEIHPIEATQ